MGEDELSPPAGRTTRWGTLAPAAGGKVMTSETGTVIALHEASWSLSIRMDDEGALHTLEATEIAADRLGPGERPRAEGAATQ